jgi:hypothetical protein
LSDFKQMPIFKWPRGLAKAVVAFENAALEFEMAYGIQFERTEDQLDECDVAIVELQSGAKFALVSYLNHPVKEVQLWIFEESASPREDLLEAVQSLRRVKLRPVWTHSEVGSCCDPFGVDEAF